MGLESICDNCKSPMCAFTFRFDLSKWCVQCSRIHSQAGAGVSNKVYRALGVLTAQHRAHINDAPYRWMCGIYGNGIRQKTKALIRHDRILRGEE